MIATIVTFVTSRIVAVFITTIVVVAAVPSLIVLVHGNTITITTGPVASAARHQDDEERARLIIEVKTAGNDVVVLLNSEEASCDSQIAQLVSVSKLSPAQTTAAIEKGKSEFHPAAAQFVREVDADENEFEHLAVVSTETEQVFLTRFLQVRVKALGEDGSAGVLITTCQTTIVEIRTIVITVVTAPPSGRGGDDD
jgi:cell division protein FtsL